ncbi:hypothetical protein [Lonsdalea quercina]
MSVNQHNGSSISDTFILSPERHVSLEEFIAFSQPGKKIAAFEVAH